MIEFFVLFSKTLEKSQEKSQENYTVVLNLCSNLRS